MDPTTTDDALVDVLERIESTLDQVVVGLAACAGLLAGAVGILIAHAT